MYWDKYECLNACPNEVQGENSVLYTLTYYIFYKKFLNNELIYNSICKGIALINKCEVAPGVFSARPSNNNDYNSHDNLTAIVIFSKFFGYNCFSVRLWEYLRSKNFIYDNLQPDNPNPLRIMHLRDIIFYGYINNNISCKLLLPVLYLMLLISLTTNRTNGKILWYLRALCLPSVFMATWKLFCDLRQLYLEYFPDKNHPINKMLSISEIN